MLKIGLWIGIPSAVTFLASSHAVRIENTVFVFALSVLALLVGIGPRLNGKSGQ